MHINLLPEHEKILIRYKADLLAIFLIVVLPGVLVLSAYWYFQYQETLLAERVTYYQNEIQSYATLWPEQQHNTTDSVVVTYASATENIWRLLGEAIQKSACLTRAIRHHHGITLEGYARSVGDIKAFLTRLSVGRLYMGAEIVKLQAVSGKKWQKFIIKLIETAKSPA